MSPLKTTLNLTASLLRLIAKAVLYWPWIVALICIISPVSLHLRIPEAFSYQPCAYIGTRGLIEIEAFDCQVIAVIDTRSETVVSW